MIGKKITYRKFIVFFSTFNVFREFINETIVVGFFFENYKIYRIGRRYSKKRHYRLPLLPNPSGLVMDPKTSQVDQQTNAQNPIQFPQSTGVIDFYTNAPHLSKMHKSIGLRLYLASTTTGHR